ncbi:MAG TPA: hypothetical protein DGT23_14870 [Micromonosporaceae bacterium]|nr:hypothetical protein [Micromonosporaceae bacterium]
MPLRKTLFAIFGSLAVAVAALPAGSAEAIRGGVDVDVAQYPWAVVITRPGSPHPQKESCGGVLLAANVIATAGHCTGTGTTWSDRTVIAGRTDLTTSAGKTARPVAVYLHPEFVSCQNGLKCGDLALWFMDGNLGTAFVTPSSSQSDDATGAVATMISWGNVGNGQYTSRSKKGEFTRATDQVCTNAGFTFTAGKVGCYGPVNGSLITAIMFSFARASGGRRSPGCVALLPLVDRSAS